MMTEGKRNWYIVDGYRPPVQPDPMITYEGHESIMVLNVNDQDAHLTIGIYFEDRDPIENIIMTIPAKRIRAFKSSDSHLLNGYKIKIGEQYSLAIRSDIGVIVQYGRLDIQQTNMAYMALLGYGD